MLGIELDDPLNLLQDRSFEVRKNLVGKKRHACNASASYRLAASETDITFSTAAIGSLHDAIRIAAR